MVASVRSGILLGQPFLDVRDPLVLIGGAQRASDNGELAAAAEQPRRLVGERRRDAFGRCLIDEEVPRIGLRVGVPGEHLDAALARLAQHARDAASVLDRDGNDVDPARDPVFDQLVLARRIETGRPIPDQIDVELTGRLLGARPATDELRIPLRLRHHGHDRTSGQRRHGGAGRSRTRGRDRADQPDIGDGHDQRTGNDGSAQHGDLTVLHVRVLHWDGRAGA